MRALRLVRAVSLAVFFLAAVAVASGAKTVSVSRQLDCGPGRYAQPASVEAGVYTCQPAPGRLAPLVSRQVVTTRDEVGLYLTNVNVRVFHIDFVAGTHYWLAIGVPFSY